MVHHGLLREREFDEEAKYIQQIEQYLDHQIVPPAKRDGIQLGWISTGSSPVRYQNQWRMTRMPATW
jgi:hypothetical protein